MVFDTIVIGAGISGLSVAHGLEQRGRTVTVLEAAPQAGGVIATTHRDGALYERGPNSTLDTSPRIAQLLAEARHRGGARGRGRIRGDPLHRARRRA